MLDNTLLIILVGVGGFVVCLVSFIAGAICASNEEDNEQLIAYLKERIHLLELRENMRVMSEHEAFMEFVQQKEKDKKPVKEQDVKKEKETSQTKWIT